LRASSAVQSCCREASSLHAIMQSSFGCSRVGCSKFETKQPVAAVRSKHVKDKQTPNCTMSAAVQEDTAGQWKALRGLLKEALLAGEIPLESKEMRPKAVFTLYKNANNPVIGADIVYGDKFSRMLRGLRKKQKNGDLQNEDKPKAVDWSKSAAKQFLKRCFREATISADYQDPKQVWTNHCKDDRAFERMQCDDAFVRRLKTVRDDYLKKVQRCERDEEAFNMAKKNHPTPEFNHRGEPQWHGSAAQNLLKAAVEAGQHKGVEPKVLWQSKLEYQVYSLHSFRDHVYQEKRLLKFRYYVHLLKKKKNDELQF
jgi:hypothetical protein